MGHPNTQKKKLLARQALCFAVCLMLMLVVPFWHDRKVIGLSLPDKEGKENPTITQTDNGFVINTAEIGKDIIGYRGTTPVEINVSDGVITRITALPNNETPEFFGAVRNSDLLETLDGKTLQEAASTHIDAVSGATYTSNAVIGNIKAGIAYALDENVATSLHKQPEKLDAKFWLTLAVILAGGIIPWFVRNRKYRIAQLCLNVGILGFWGGTFLCYSLITGYLANGIHFILLLPTVLMLVAAFIFPFFGKKDYYCLWMCPYGSLQELLGRCVKVKIRMSAKTVKILNYLRQALWFVLMWLLWTGLCFDWMGLEPFTAFFFGDASLAVLIIAGVFLLLSLFIQRPYCRFVCPTGSLFKYAEGTI